MKHFLIIVLIASLMMFTIISCVGYKELYMREIPVRLVKKTVVERMPGDHLLLTWRSFDEKIEIITEAKLEDSSQYVVGQVYARSFLKR
jgi:hypothetical protein